jgi:ribosomal protein S14
MTAKPKPAITNKKPCEVCGAQIKAVKDYNLCKPCADRVATLNNIWRQHHA